MSKSQHPYLVDMYCTTLSSTQPSTINDCHKDSCWHISRITIVDCFSQRILHQPIAHRLEMKGRQMSFWEVRKVSLVFNFLLLRLGRAISRLQGIEKKRKKRKGEFCARTPCLSSGSNANWPDSVRWVRVCHHRPCVYKSAIKVVGWPRNIS